jgi:hypothetical protein
MIPPFALSLWLVEETLTVAYPDGQQVSLPVSEAPRLLTILRRASARALQPPKRPAGQNLAKAFTEADIRAAGEKIRAYHEARRAEPQRKAEPQRRGMSSQEADKILKAAGI